MRSYTSELEGNLELAWVHIKILELFEEVANLCLAV